MVNPYFIQPGGDLSQGLQGITETIRQNRKDKVFQDEIDRQKQFREATAQAFGVDPATGQVIQQPMEQTQEEYIPDLSSPETAFNFESIVNPDEAKFDQSVLDEMGITPDKYEEVKEFTSSAKDAPVEELRTKTIERVNMVQERGGDARDTAKLLMMPENQARQALNIVDLIVDRQALRRMAAIDPIATQNILKSSKQTGETDFTRKMALFDEWVSMPEDTESEKKKKNAFGMVIGAIPRGRSAEEAIQVGMSLEEKKTEEAKKREMAKSDIAVGEFKEKEDIRIQTEPKKEAAIAAAKEKVSTSADIDKQIAQFESEMPALEDVTNKLIQLSDSATYTTAGKTFDMAARELGFEPRKGATDRAAYIATVNNEVLPMLRRMLGAAFTENEGQRVMALLGNPDSSPGEKKAQLQAYIEAKRREVSSLKRKKELLSPTASGTTKTGLTWKVVQ